MPQHQHCPPLKVLCTQSPCHIILVLVVSYSESCSQNAR
jgi:hypothetical protein